MTTQERFTRALRGQGGLDRLPMIEWATYWDKPSIAGKIRASPKIWLITKS